MITAGHVGHDRRSFWNPPLEHSEVNVEGKAKALHYHIESAVSVMTSANRSARCRIISGCGRLSAVRQEIS